MTHSKEKLGFNGAWAMAVGGMIGGGIFSTLGVVVSIVGPWAWLSFLAAGVIALASGYSYGKLATHYDKPGGVFTFLRGVEAPGFAGGLAWILIAGYVLTNAVYAFTLGKYLGHVAGLGPWFPRAIGATVIAGFIWLNLKGVSAAGGVEIFLVWFKLVVLVGLAVYGMTLWNPALLSRNVPDANISVSLFGAASVFMAYEGFQLLTYNYDEIDTPRTTLPYSVLLGIGVVMIVYVMVTLGTSMLIGAGQIVDHKEVALAIAGRQAWGDYGLAAVTVAAAFSTGSAINATLFATARLANSVARAGELPAALGHKNAANVPDRAVIALGAAAAVFAAAGSLTMLVEAASLAFLFTFCVVCGLAFHKGAGLRIITGFGALAGGAACIALIFRLTETSPMSLLLLSALTLVCVFGRPVLLRYTRTEDPG